MKIKTFTSDGFDLNKIILGATLITILAYNSDNISSSENNNLLPLYEIEENGVQKSVNEHKNKNYIKNLTTIMSSNNYAPLKMLYKLQSVLEDASTVKSLQLNSNDLSNSSLQNVLYEIEPYINNSKLSNINRLTDNLDQLQTTVNQIGTIKNKITNLPDDAPKSEKIKTLVNEIPNLTNLPGLDEIKNIKNMLELLNLKKEIPVVENDEADNEELQYEEVLNFVDMFDK